MCGRIRWSLKNATCKDNSKTVFNKNTIEALNERTWSWRPKQVYWTLCKEWQHLITFLRSNLVSNIKSRRNMANDIWAARLLSGIKSVIVWHSGQNFHMTILSSSSCLVNEVANFWMTKVTLELPKQNRRPWSLIDTGQNPDLVKLEGKAELEAKPKSCVDRHLYCLSKQ